MIYTPLMVVAYHLIWGCYGFWLPNDPRGSGSTRVWSDAIRAFGEATKVQTRHSVAHRAHDATRRVQAKQALKQPPMRLTGVMAKAVGQSIYGVRGKRYALAVMPDHMHVVVAADERSPEQVMRQIKQAATVALRRVNLIEPDRMIWQRKGWVVNLNGPSDVVRAIKYVQNNPVQAGLKRQHWSCVDPFAR